MNEYIVRKIKQARTERGLTQKDLARKLNRTSASISDLERGKVQVSANDLGKLAEFLEKPIEYFYGEGFGSSDIENLVAVIRKMDPDVRSEQINIINSLLAMQINLANFDKNIGETELKEVAKQTYDHLITYLNGVRQLYDKGIVAKNMLEDILGIGESSLPDID